MSVNSFRKKCQEIPRTDNIFGLCDDQNGTKAYSNTSSPKKWIASVKNDNKIEITFTAIDNCIIIFKKHTKYKESTCDGMITFSDSVYLVELKKQKTGGWISDALGQLENTMKLFQTNPVITQCKYKKAFACNKKHPGFHTIDNEKNKWFFRNYGFRIDIQDEIIIK